MKTDEFIRLTTTEAGLVGSIYTVGHAVHDERPVFKEIGRLFGDEGDGSLVDERYQEIVNQIEQIFESTNEYYSLTSALSGFDLGVGIVVSHARWRARRR